MIALITHSIVPYCYDIHHVLGFPSGLTHRFRYRERWIDLPHPVSNLRGQNAVVILRNFHTGDFIPIRHVTISDVLTIGDTHYVEFALGALVDPAIAHSVSDKLTSDLVARGADIAGGHQLSPLVFETTTLPSPPPVSPPATEHAHWTAILATLASLDCYRDFSFLRILHVRDARGRPARIAPDVTRRNSFSLFPGRLYVLDVAQYVPWDISTIESISRAHDVVLKAEPATITILRGVQRVVGKYDVLRFIFKTSHGYTPHHTLVELESQATGDAAQYVLPTFLLPLQIAPPTWVRLVTVVRRSIGVLVAVAFLFITILRDAAHPLLYPLLGELGFQLAPSLLLFILIVANRKWDDLITRLVDKMTDVPEQ